MSISGAGVLDSDAAHDLYQGVLDRYDAGMPLEQICEWIAAFEAQAVDALELECLLAAGVKVLWEIGHPDDVLLARLLRVLDSGESRALWFSDGGTPDLAKARDGVLNRLLKQIAQPKVKPRPRRRYPQVKRRLFELGDCLELTMVGQKTYRGVVCKIDQRRGRCEYAVLVMANLPDSAPDSFRAGTYFGHYIHHFAVGRLAGPHVIRMDHAMLVREQCPFRVVGRVDLDPESYSPGSWGGVLCMQHVVDDFERTLANDMGAFRKQRLPLSNLLRR
ncbi:hypothetical protein [Pelomonas aquatica]|jgi:hypothetical protein|uniref:Uncharacterized protein n=1 Tax=Pelomonas aquatica TaxID=431058 RepID=A0A9X4LKV1_9BURK|nr:hypothetical protein [Pelomonas aquatica]MDG0865098.1 hypothetical protein [Pelomonas aquatica]